MLTFSALCERMAAAVINLTGRPILCSCLSPSGGFRQVQGDGLVKLNKRLKEIWKGPILHLLFLTWNIFFYTSKLMSASPQNDQLWLTCTAFVLGHLQTPHLPSGRRLCPGRRNIGRAIHWLFPSRKSQKGTTQTREAAHTPSSQMEVRQLLHWLKIFI